MNRGMNKDTLLAQLRQLSLFSRLSPAQMAMLLESAVEDTAQPGEVLIQQGAVDRDYIVLLDGELEVRRLQIGHTGKEEKSVGVVKPGAGVGEMAILSAVPRRASVHVTKPARFLRFDGERVSELIAWSQAFAQRIRSDAEMRHRTNMIRQIGAFRHLPLLNVQLALERMHPVIVQPGETVVRQGDKGDSYFILESGAAEVWRRDPKTGESSCLKVLQAGDTFGEEALLLGHERGATVTMVTMGRLWILEKKEFDDLLRPVMVEEIEAEAAKALVESGKAQWLDCRYKEEFDQSRIPGAWPAPLEDLRERSAHLDAETTYIVYSRNGRRSACAAFLLGEKGLKAMHLKGGILDWPYALESGAH